MPPPPDADVQAVLDRPAVDPDVLRVLHSDYLDYREPLTAAWAWNRSGLAGDTDRAQQLLAALAGKHPNAPRVWFELAFSLVKDKKRPLAVKLLAQKIGPAFGGKLDTDTFALWGRCHKDQGDEYKRRGEFASAEQEYARAEARYEDAYNASSRDRFPGINVATLRLLQAAMRALWVAEPSAAAHDRDEAAAHEAFVGRRVNDCKQRAAEVLASRPTWQPKLSDDAIWMAATEAEAYLLLGRWTESEQMYRTALRPENAPQSHHFQSAGDQLRRLCEAFRDLGGSPPAPFDDPGQFIAGLATK